MSCRSVEHPRGATISCSVHPGPHIALPQDAEVSVLDDGTLHVVTTCSSSEHRCEEHPGEDPYILWYVAGSPGYNPPTAPPDTNDCVNLRPYATGSTPGPIPNPNNIDSRPGSPYPVVTRHWPTPNISYYINVPAAVPAAANAIELPQPPPLMAIPIYTYAEFSADIQTIMNSVANQPNVAINSCTLLGITTTDYDTTPTPFLGGAAQSTGPSQGEFQWQACAGGPTLDGLNEFIFLRARPLGRSVGGLTSMNVDPTTGEILECDVIYEGLNPLIAWGPLVAGVPIVPFSTGLPHEIGHFFGLDHTNLHPGGMGPIFPPPGTPPSRAVYPTLDNIPSMAAAFVIGCPGSRVTTPWTQDDIAGLAAIYPVNELSAPGVTPIKRPLINDFGRIIGSVTAAGGSVFGSNVFPLRRLPDPGYGLPMMAGTPSVGTISGTARRLGSVVGSVDTQTMALTTGDFQIDGIAQADYDIVVEPLGSLGLLGATPVGTSFGEWWFDPFINPTNNVPALVPNGQVNRISLNPIGGFPQVSSLQVIPGTVIVIATPIDVSPGSGNTLEAVSRPLVDIQPRIVRPVAPSLVTVTVTHNISGYVPASPGVPGSTPLLKLTVTWNGTPVRLGFSSSAPAPVAPPQVGLYTTVYQFLVSSNMRFPAVVEAFVTEVPIAGIAAVVGRGEVRY